MQQILEAAGANVAAVLEEAGIDREEIHRPGARVAWTNFERLVCATVAITGDRALALRIGDYIHPTSYYPVGIAFLSSSTLFDFCQRAARFSSIYSTNYQVEFVDNREGVRLICTQFPSVRKSEIAYLSAEGWLVVILRFIRYMYKPDYRPLRVCIASPCMVADEQRYEQHFGCPVEFNADQNAFFIDIADLHIPLPAANADLARQSDRVVIEFLNKLGRVDILSQLHAKIIDLLPSGNCDMQKVARSLCMSSRKLHSKLADSGTSFQQVLDDTRRELAEQYLQERELSISEIAYMLGFSDCSNFSRAFKRWTGETPTKYSFH